MAGTLVAFEGIQASGKSTQIDLLCSALKESKRTSFVSKATDVSKFKALNAFLNDLGILPDSKAATYAFQALNCIQHDNAETALNSHDYVLADRWSESFLAYLRLNSTRSRLDENLSAALVESAYPSLKPAVTFLIDISAPTAAERYNARQESGDKRKEARSANFFSRTRNYYMQAAERRSWIIINGERPAKLVSQEIRSHIFSLR